MSMVTTHKLGKLFSRRAPTHRTNDDERDRHAGDDHGGPDADDYAAAVADADCDLPPETVAAMVREIRPSWSVREAALAEEGTDVVYFVTAETPAGPRECVLKACEFLDPRAFRPEPYLMDVVGRRTAVPVPKVVGAVDDHPDLPAPFYLMERRDGEVFEGESRDLPAGVIERLARDAGRYLADLHALGDFEAFGTVVLARDAADGRDAGTRRDGLTVADRDSPTDGATLLTTDDEATDSWRTRVEEIVAANRGSFNDRFADLEADLRRYVEARLDALDGEFGPVLGDDDYRLGNLLVDPETGEMGAVLDWGNTGTLEAQYNLVVTEQHLSGWARPRGAPRGVSGRERARRTRLRAGRRASPGVVSGGHADVPAGLVFAVVRRVERRRPRGGRGDASRRSPGPARPVVGRDSRAGGGPPVHPRRRRPRPPTGPQTSASQPNSAATSHQTTSDHPVPRYVRVSTDASTAHPSAAPTTVTRTPRSRPFQSPRQTPPATYPVTPPANAPASANRKTEPERTPARMVPRSAATPNSRARPFIVRRVIRPVI
ncbi:phosphotransferase [Halorussus gelatinilyticus]|uniref:Phosphotransferase n=1 Tax=Halorussus gelatinilyticus TaxID=2937524 RepID=A0A8U0ID99_9EURY|nr:phosphotransferase [Halorussus gelatinilyticus]UPV99029.1 phosphotransferase [Halorussus gelatinilyticus]